MFQKLKTATFATTISTFREVKKTCKLQQTETTFATKFHLPNILPIFSFSPNVLQIWISTRFTLVRMSQRQRPRVRMHKEQSVASNYKTMEDIN